MARKSRSDSYEGRTEPLLTLCLSITDCHHSTPKWTESGYLVIRNFNIQNGTLVLDDASYTDEQTYQERIGRAKPEPGDLVISREAPMGQVAMIPEGVECCLGQRMVLIKPDPRKVDARYLLFAMQSEFVQKQIGVSDKTGSTVSNLRIPLLKELAIPVFDKEVESHIASVLSAIDDKIALNKRINAELETMAKLLHDYWFVQFDFPNVKGKPYKSSGGAMVYNTELKREVPEGWEVKPLTALVNVSKEALDPMADPTRVYRHYSIPAYDICEGYAIEKGIEIKSSKFVVRELDILVSKLNPRFNRVVYAELEEDAIASSEFVVWRTVDCALKNFLFMVARSGSFISHCSQSASGTSNSHKRVNPDVMMRFGVPFNAVLAKQYGEMIGPSLRLLASNRRENIELTTLRDWLLPMLMNGQVRVGEAAEKVPPSRNASADNGGTPSPKASATEGLAMAAEPTAAYKKKQVK